MATDYGAVDTFSRRYLKAGGVLKDKCIQRWNLATDIYASGIYASGIFGAIKIDGPTTSGYILTTDSEGWGTWQPSVDGVTNFLALTDTPASYLGMAASGVRVNSVANGLEFYDTSTVTPITSFLDLTDSPDSYVGFAASGVRVNSSANGLEFYPTSDGASGEPNYLHTQSVASATWTINHNLGTTDIVAQVFSNDSPRKVINPQEIEITSVNTVTVTFPVSVAGYAVINSSGVSGSDSAGSIIFDNVKNYGAVGDGVSDDTVPIQNAINSCATSKKICFIPPGTYVHSDLTVPGGVVINGVGYGSILSYSGSGSAISSQTPGTRIYSLKIENLRINASSGSVGLSLDSVSTSIFNNLTISGFTTGVDIYSPTSGYSVYNRFYNVLCNACGTGFYLRGTSSNANVFISSRANVSTSYGFLISDSNDNTLENCQIESTTGYGVSITASSVGLSDANRITNCRFEGTMTKAVIIGANVRGTFISNLTAPGMNTADVLSDSGTYTSVFGVSPNNNTTKAIRVSNDIVTNTNTFFGGLLANTTTSNNASVAVPTTGSKISRNIADANPALIVDLVHASSTGKILDLQAQGVSKANVDLSGNITGVSFIKSGGTSDQFLMADGSTTTGAGSTAITGEIKLWPTDSAPTGYLLCNGATFSATTYATLASLLGDTYGAHSGDNYYLPDLRGRVPVGKSTDTEFDTLGETGGAKTHTLQVTEMPAHTHSYTNPHAGSGSNYHPTDDNQTGSSSETTGSTGGGQAHNNLQPYITLNYIIKT